MAPPAANADGHGMMSNPAPRIEPDFLDCASLRQALHLTDSYGENMRTRLRTAALFGGFLPVVMTISVLAQEGFPLDGTWRGDWGLSDADRTLVVMVMKWDGENINGTINPGPNSYPFTAAVLKPSDWSVHIEAENPDGEQVISEGSLSNIGSYNRSIEGTWTQDDIAHSFRIARE